MIEIKNVSKWFGDFKVLSDINETVERGQTMVICGPSGSGKSTLLRCVNGLEPYEKGEIIVDGVSLSDPKTNLYKLREIIFMDFGRIVERGTYEEFFNNPKTGRAKEFLKQIL